MQVIAGFFGSGALAALLGHGAALSHYFKKLAQLAKLATSYILKQSLIQTPVQFSRDPYVVEIPGRMGMCMPYVVYPINASRVFVRELFYIQIA